MSKRLIAPSSELDRIFKDFSAILTNPNAKKKSLTRLLLPSASSPVFLIFSGKFPIPSGTGLPASSLKPLIFLALVSASVPVALIPSLALSTPPFTGFSTSAFRSLIFALLFSASALASCRFFLKPSIPSLFRLRCISALSSLIRVFSLSTSTPSTTTCISSLASAILFPLSVTFQAPRFL